MCACDSCVVHIHVTPWQHLYLQMATVISVGRGVRVGVFRLFENVRNNRLLLHQLRVNYIHYFIIVQL